MPISGARQMLSNLTPREYRRNKYRNVIPSNVELWSLSANARRSPAFLVDYLGKMPVDHGSRLRGQSSAQTKDLVKGFD